MMKVFITKFALTRGIYESEEGEIREDKYFMSRIASYPNAFLKPLHYRLSLEEAKEQSEMLRLNKIKFYEQELIRLKKLSF